MDSNHDKQIQNLQCYRYTTRQKGLEHRKNSMVPLETSEALS